MSRRNFIALALSLGIVGLLITLGVGLYNRQQNIDNAVAKINAGYEESKHNDVTQDALTGIWQTEGMVATVTQSTIEIKWKDEDTEALYWKGTFVVPTRLVDGSKIMSDGDTGVMSESMMASQDSTKEFTFEKNTLSFKLTALGVTKTVRLVRV